MKIAEVKYLGNLRTEATHLKSGNIVITDAPPDNNGKGEAFSPSDLLASSLASCMITIMGIVAQRNNINIEGTTAGVTKIMKSDPRRVGEVIIEISIPKGTLTQKDQIMLENAARTCPVAKSLSEELKQTLIINYR
jgi:putative redox protein